MRSLHWTPTTSSQPQQTIHLGDNRQLWMSPLSYWGYSSVLCVWVRALFYMFYSGAMPKHYQEQCLSNICSAPLYSTVFCTMTKKLSIVKWSTSFFKLCCVSLWGTVLLPYVLVFVHHRERWHCALQSLEILGGSVNKQLTAVRSYPALETQPVLGGIGR